MNNNFLRCNMRKIAILRLILLLISFGVNLKFLQSLISDTIAHLLHFKM